MFRGKCLKTWCSVLIVKCNVYRAAAYSNGSKCRKIWTFDRWSARDPLSVWCSSLVAEIVIKYKWQRGGRWVLLGFFFCLSWSWEGSMRRKTWRSVGWWAASRGFAFQSGFSKVYHGSAVGIGNWWWSKLSQLLVVVVMIQTVVEIIFKFQGDAAPL